MERETNGSIAFLDMSIERSQNKLSSKWYTKPTDTGLTMNYHAIAPNRYKRSVVCGLVHRIYRACSCWKKFHESLEKAKIILENNQYPSEFFEPIIRDTITKIIEKENALTDSDDNNVDEENTEEEKMLFLQYRGKISEKFQQSLRKIKAPCKVVFTLNKLKSNLPSLKPLVEKFLKSGIVYKFLCPRCESCYVGQTSRHLVCRFKEHRRSGPVQQHWKECAVDISMDDVSILCTNAKSIYHLMTLEALFINEIKPNLNTKDEYKSRPLVIKF